MPFRRDSPPFIIIFITVTPHLPGRALLSHLLSLSWDRPIRQERLFLFRELICKDVDWTGLGMPAYSCFDAFFKRIWSEAVSAPAPPTPTAPLAKAEAETATPTSATAGAGAGAAAGVVKLETVPVGAGGAGPGTGPGPGGAVQEDLTDLGVDTLWRVTLTSLNKEVADSATNDLLEVSREARGFVESTMVRSD